MSGRDVEEDFQKEVFKQLPRFDGEGFGEVFGSWNCAQSRSFRNEMIFFWIDAKSAMPLPARLLPLIFQDFTISACKSPEKRWAMVGVCDRR